MEHTLISTKEALKILTWVSYAGLHAGCKGTGKLTRFPHGTFSKEECEALRDEMLAAGFGRDGSKFKLKRGRQMPERECPADLV